VVLIGFLFAILSFYLYSLRNAGSKSKDWFHAVKNEETFIAFHSPLGIWCYPG
jgi:hypothetical protein